jgi:hypothetical protein
MEVDSVEEPVVLWLHRQLAAMEVPQHQFHHQQRGVVMAVHPATMLGMVRDEATDDMLTSLGS